MWHPDDDPSDRPNGGLLEHRTSYLLPVAQVQLPSPHQFRMRLGFDIDVDEINQRQRDEVRAP